MADETAASETKAAAPIQIPPGTVRLRSSDGHLVPVDRLTLAAASSVFRDTFEVVFTDEEAAEDCPVAETLEELDILVKGLEGNANRSEADWLTLYKFMDKYDMEPLRILLRLMARDMLRKDPIAAYCAGAVLSDRKIQKTAARLVIKKQIELQRLSRRKIWNAAPEQERLRLLAFQRQWIIVGWRKINTAKEALPPHQCIMGHSKCLGLFPKIWDEAVYKVVPVPDESLGSSSWYNSSQKSAGNSSNSSSSSDDSSDDELVASSKRFDLEKTILCTVCQRDLLWRISDVQATWKGTQKELSLFKDTDVIDPPEE